MDQEMTLSGFQKLCKFMEKNTIGTEVAIYGTSSLLLMVAYLKRKPAYLVRQFKQPSHIPEKIINERIMHTGLIKEIQQRDQNTILLIQHRPLIPIFTSRKRLLPIKLPGVQVNANGYSWLQQCLIGKEATFLPLDKIKNQDYVVCQLCLVHPPKGNQLLDVSEALLKLKFAKYIADEASRTNRNSKYYKHLVKTQEKVSTKEAWFLWLTRHPFLWSKFNDLKESFLPKQKLLPEFVR